MRFKEISPKVYELGFPIVNAFLVDDGELTIIDTGTKGSEKDIIKAIERVGKRITDLKHIILTHHHGDHIGSAAALKQLSGAKVYAYRTEAMLIEEGLASSVLYSSPGLLNHIIHKLIVMRSKRVKSKPVKVDVKLDANDIVNGRFKLIATPGHCGGHISVLYKDVLFAADACANSMGLGFSIAHESIEQAAKSIELLAKEDFSVAGFGHGKPILKDASEKLRTAKFYKKYLKG